MNFIKNIKLDNEVKYYKNSNDFYNAHLVVDYFNNNNKSVFVVLSNLYEAQKYYDYLNQITKSDDILFYPVDQTLTTIMSLGSFEFQSERLYTLNKLLEGNKKIVITTLDGILMRQLSPADYINSTLTLEMNKDYNYENIIDFLVTSGYKNEYISDSPGTFSVRGGIVDIFPRDSKHGIRLDFFDTYLESIKYFDVSTQRSFAEVDKIVIKPLSELFYTNEMLENALKNINKFRENFNLSKDEEERLKEDLMLLQERRRLQTLNIYIPFFNNDKDSVLSFSDDYSILIIDEDKIIRNNNQREEDFLVFDRTMHGNFYSSIPLYNKIEYLMDKVSFSIDNRDVLRRDGVNLFVNNLTEYNNNTSLLLYDIKNVYNDYKIIFNIMSKSNEDIIIKMMDGISFNNYEIFNNYYLGSFNIIRDKLLIIDEETIFGKKNFYKANYRSVINQATKINDAYELEIGDYVVHYDFGIGKYVGIKTMELSGGTKDYLHILYRDDETLYVPMDQLNMILRYSTKDGFNPKLSKMSGKEWSRTKASVKKKIKDLSDYLVDLYAKREQAIGYSFLPDDKMQEAFENDFEYDLTKDQEESIIKVKELMEKPTPMDLLLVGDVGFGKTEVALRAAFKAVLSGKQVMYLVPTTILARQHYLTFKNRMEKYGANVRLLNRFVSKREQTETIEGLGKGIVDVVVGTHRLLSKDIVVKDLGLLIIDEEQRFGVLHKEKIKEIKVNVDTLTLSATPIPRTLQMSLMGLKELSTIETPPLNRYPVQTYIVRKDDGLIKEAIRRELARGGQVFYLYNRVTDIERVVLNLEHLVPEAKIRYAHGQMTKVGLENTIRDFIDHEFDVLVATTIIETGIDIPNTNTLIIDGADTLGLSQLYQIRGRVGRSDKIAYSYLMYERNKDINDEAYKRLKVLEEFTELGSGYKIALRDLAVRGAGDILGSEQSGFIDSVGLDMYMQLLDEVIHNKDELKVSADTLGEFSKRKVDKDYISKDSIRIEIHRRIASLESVNELDDLKLELEDRFGKFDEDLLIYMHEQLFKKMCDKLGVYKVENGRTYTKIYLTEEKSKNIDGKKLFTLVNNWKHEIKLGYLNNEVVIEFIYNTNNIYWMFDAANFIEMYLK